MNCDLPDVIPNKMFLIKIFFSDIYTAVTFISKTFTDTCDTECIMTSFVS